MKNWSLPVSAFIIGISFIFSAWILRDVVEPDAKWISKSSSISTASTDVLTKKQLSAYLHISEKTLDSIIEKDEADKKEMIQNGYSYDTYNYIPYLKLDREIRFLKSEVDKWLLYQNEHRE